MFHNCKVACIIAGIIVCVFCGYLYWPHLALVRVWVGGAACLWCISSSVHHRLNQPPAQTLKKSASMYHLLCHVILQTLAINQTFNTTTVFVEALNEATLCGIVAYGNFGKRH